MGAKGRESVDIVSLAHPKTGEATAYLSTQGGVLMEVQEAAPLDADPCSWFVDQTVQKDGTLFVASRVDPLFFLLPLLAKNGTRFSPLGQVVTPQLHAACTETRARAICEVNDKLGADMVLFKIDEEKVMGWLQRKVERLQRVLASREMKVRLECASGAAAADFQSLEAADSARAHEDQKAEGCEGPTDVALKEQLLTAVQLVCEYLDQGWSDKLLQRQGVLDEAPVEKKVRARCGMGVWVCVWVGGWA